MHFLIIEDEKPLLESLIAYLSEKGFYCYAAVSLAEALKILYQRSFDFILVDIGLPDGNGLDIVKSIREKNLDAGIIVITARNGIQDKEEGFSLGADDYLTKPFHLSELHLRIQSIHRRRSPKISKEILFNEIRVVLSDMSVYLHEKMIALTKKEYTILIYFLSNRNQVVTKEAIAQHLLGEDVNMMDSLDFIYSHIKNLRKKMLESGSEDYIKTIYGIGYKFSA